MPRIIVSECKYLSHNKESREDENDQLHSDHSEDIERYDVEGFVIFLELVEHGDFSLFPETLIKQPNRTCNF